MLEKRPVGENEVQVTFIFVPNGDFNPSLIQSVHLMGNFKYTTWEDGYEMCPYKDRWECILCLPKYKQFEYKIALKIFGHPKKIWVEDAEGDGRAKNAHGTFNSIVNTGEIYARA